MLCSRHSVFLFSFLEQSILFENVVVDEFMTRSAVLFEHVVVDEL
jgi:hypothetical protein